MPRPARLRPGNQIVAGPLRVRRMLENRIGVRAQDPEPVVEVGRIHLERMRRETELLAQETGRQLRDDFFACVGRVSEPGQTVVAVQAMRCLCGMGIMPTSA